MHVHALLQILCCGRAEPKFYKDNRAEIDALNSRLLYFFGAGGVLLCATVALSSVFLSELVPMRLFYALAAVGFGLVWLFARYVRDRAPHYARLVFYLLACASNAVALVMGTYYSPAAPASVFWVLLLAISVLVFDKPVYSLVIAGGFTALLCAVSRVIKADAPFALHLDYINAAFTLLLTIFMVYYFNDLRVTNLRALQMFRVRSEQDKLTGVMNKATTEALCGQYLLDPHHPGCAMMIIDLDHFKDVNDTLGHAQGDAVLHEAGRKLKAVFRESDIVGRFGGDEFLVLMKGTARPEIAQKKADEVCAQMRSIFSDLTVNRITCSIGIALANVSEGCSFRQLFGRADDALYHAKAEGRDRWQLFRETGTESSTKPMLLVVDDTEISRAILHSCFESDYEVLQAEDGLQGLALMRRYHDRLRAVLLDIEMPRMNGYQVLSEIRRDTRLQGFPVLVITSYEKHELQSLEMGAVDLITKPFDPMVVRKRVANAIARTHCETAGGTEDV